MSVRHRKGFTLVEMLVVIAIIAVLAALLFPAVQAAREAMRRAQCGNNQRELVRAIQSYDGAKGRLPPARTPSGVATPAVYSWVPSVLAYFGQQNIQNQLTTSPIPRLEILECPSDPGYVSIAAPLNYVVNGGRPNAPHQTLGSNHDWSANGVFDDLAAAGPPVTGYVPTSRMSIADVARKDGSSTTILLSENANRRATGGSNWNYGNNENESCILWAPPPPGAALNTILPVGSSLDNNYAIPSSYHTNGFQVTFCDGHVQFINDKIAYHVYVRLMTSDGVKVRVPGTNTVGPTVLVTGPPAIQSDTPLSDTDY